MFWKTSLLLLGLGVALSAKLQLTIHTNHKIERLTQQTEELREQNPNNAMYCFDYYKPLLNNTATQYEADYDICMKEYTKNCAAVDANWVEERTQIAQNGERVCRDLDNCNNIGSYADAFECFAQQAAEDAKTMYVMSANATEIAAKIQEEYRVVETQQSICINRAERAYVENTTETYEQLNDCLLNGIVVPVDRSTPGVDLSEEEVESDEWFLKRN